MAASSSISHETGWASAINIVIKNSTLGWTNANVVNGAGTFASAVYTSFVAGTLIVGLAADRDAGDERVAPRPHRALTNGLVGYPVAGGAHTARWKWARGAHRLTVAVDTGVSRWTLTVGTATDCE